jgi:DNA primase
MAAHQMIDISGGSRRDRRLRPIDFENLKATIPILDLLESIGWQPARVRHGGAELRGPCPIHASASQQRVIFSVTPSRNIFKCFKCNAGGDTIALAAYLFGIPLDQRVTAAVELCKHLGTEIPRLT